MPRKTITVTRNAQGMWVVAKGGKTVGTYLVRADAETSAISQLDKDGFAWLQFLPSKKKSGMP